MRINLETLRTFLTKKVFFKFSWLPSVVFTVFDPQQFCKYQKIMDPWSCSPLQRTPISKYIQDT